MRILPATDLDGELRALPDGDHDAYVRRFESWCEQAHVLLPSATYAERDGTFTNFQGYLQRINAAFAPRGEAWPAWQIGSTWATYSARVVAAWAGAAEIAIASKAIAIAIGPVEAMARALINPPTRIRPDRSRHRRR